MAHYKDLLVWQKAMDMVVAIYTLTNLFPSSELYSITSQMRRAAVSIPSNIAEGSKRSTRKDYRNFLLNSLGSGAELETQLQIAKRLPWGKSLSYETIDKLLNEVMRMLSSITIKLHTQKSQESIT
jgi:four helix bundle protein